MADRLISANALGEQVERLIKPKSTEAAWVFGDVLALIEDAPSVDAEPVRHGEWTPEITDLGTMVFRCSACQRLSDVHWAYCPRCGAKMDGERREDG